ncbi:FAD-binding protein [Paracoccus sp. S3-43]|uniref:FAD-binding protein n=1 Tax=Paracoccus sp. S3-43 TaxID=3030011 RepID=UPI0023B07152|nr:FAD-binding protein [Paracoccus sp. S3-43]WEF24510.1 FAD-binding protein [Paracoccus sp. S3-43]
MTVALDLAPTTEAELAEIVADCHARSSPLRIAGGGTRVENRTPGEPLSLSRLSGVVTYSPGEMTLIARPGTPLPEIQAMLEAEGQALAFEPPDLRGVLGGNGTPTLGGMVAANASGPRRVLAGACRDHLLGVRFVDGRGRVLKTGGRVMKNVTGLDLSKLLAGSHGTLAVLTEVVLKTLPLLPARCTLAFPGTGEATALRIFTIALSTPFEVSGAALVGGTAYLRMEGLERQLAYRRDRLLALLADWRPEVLDDAPWDAIRDVAHFADGGPLWRILCKPTDAPGFCAGLRAMGGDCSLDWGGGLIWYRGPGNPRALAAHATLIRRDTATGPAFPPQTGAVARLQDGLRRAFDPAGILNPGLMGA